MMKTYDAYRCIEGNGFSESIAKAIVWDRIYRNRQYAMYYIDFVLSDLLKHFLDCLG